MIRIFLLLIALSIFSNRATAQDIYRVKADKVNVRASNNAKSKVVATVNQNENVIVLDATDSKLYKVKLKSGEGWMSKDFLEKIVAPTKNTQNPTTQITPTNTTVSPQQDIIYRVTTDNLRVRKEADPKSKVIGYLPENENVAVIDSSNTTYFKIKVTNGEGYVSKEFLARVSPVTKPVTESTVAASVPQETKDYTSIIFIAIVAIILFTILYFSIKYASGNKALIAFSVIIILVIGYFCFITFIQPKVVSGTFSSNEDIQYKNFNFKSKDSVTVTDAFTDSVFTSKYVIDGEMIKLYDQQNTIMLLIRDDNTLIGEGFTRGKFSKK